MSPEYCRIARGKPAKMIRSRLAAFATPALAPNRTNSAANMAFQIGPVTAHQPEHAPAVLVEHHVAVGARIDMQREHVRPRVVPVGVER